MLKKMTYLEWYFSDFEKAFDSIDHEFLMKCLKHFNFSEDFVNWIRLFYSNATSCVTNDDFQSDFFPVKRGVRQGCPLSPYFVYKLYGTTKLPNKNKQKY